ncbi:hypothetical protein [Candidatus Methylospira mobilis]|uniref:hypothetical protein n=1 Tax=Candidatus Methylospira mobilis TaxID=1808979 RepID=UPI001293F6DE|nr:hypothetical protein [Candidatus Methylospira mobilis]
MSRNEAITYFSAVSLFSTQEIEEALTVFINIASASGYDLLACVRGSGIKVYH